MFANTYQNGYYTEVWDSRVNPQKNATYKQLFKKIPSSLKNFYDKQVKSFIFELEGNERLCFPYDDRQQLSLHQRYLVLQIYIPIGSNWSLQLGFNDISNNKKRINITTTSGKQQLKYFSFRYPLQNGVLQKGVWMFLAIDIYSFCNAFKNTVFRSLDSIVICSSCKIRRIFTMKQWTQFQIPKTYWLNPNIPQTMQIIEYKQMKQTSNNNLLSSVQYSKLVQSKVVQNHNSLLRNSQKSSPLQQKSNLKPTVKLPGVNNNRIKDFTPLKSSKLSQKIQLSKSQLGKDKGGLYKDYGGLGRSNRSLTKGDIIIQKSKIRLNSLQQKQQQIMNRIKSQDHRFSDKLPIKKTKHLKNENLFRSDLFRSQLTQSGITQSKISKLGNYSPKIIKVKKQFEQDNIFKEQSYSSSYSRITQKQSRNTLRNNSKSQYMQNKNQHMQKQIRKRQNAKINGNEFKQMQAQQQSSQNNITHRKQIPHDIKKIKPLKQNKTQIKQRQQIIQQDVWTQQQQEYKKPQTPIQQIIQTQQNPSIISSINPSQTIITKQNNHQVITKHSLNTLKSHNQLELIYDQMIGCYYHPQTNTYYQIKN